MGNRNLFWLQTGACGGDTMSLVDMEAPDLHQLLENNTVDLLWHPSLSTGKPDDFDQMVDRILTGEQPLDILCIEGFIINGPNGTGTFDTYRKIPKRDMVKTLAERASYVVAVGTCAAFGGMGISAGVQATGLQFTKEEPGGLLGYGFRSAKGLPVINVPGCPIHPVIIFDLLNSLFNDSVIPLTDLNEPEDWYSTFVHQGCIRNEYHEYRVEEREFGDRGCLFFHMGCRGPLTKAPCNKIHWNRRSSKTNIGVPCVGCTSPDFPRDKPFFTTDEVDGEPVDLPNGVERELYSKLKKVAAQAAPDRLKKRKTPL